MRKRKKKSTTADPIFVSPDGGETVYQQLPDGNRVLVEQSQKAKDEETATEPADYDVLQNSFIEFNTKIDNIRKEKFDTVFPEYSKLFE